MSLPSGLSSPDLVELALGEYPEEDLIIPPASGVSDLPLPDNLLPSEIVSLNPVLSSSSSSPPALGGLYPHDKINFSDGPSTTSPLISGVCDPCISSSPTLGGLRPDDKIIVSDVSDTTSPLISGDHELFDCSPGSGATSL